MDGLVKSGMVGMLWFDGMVGMPYYTVPWCGLPSSGVVWYGFVHHGTCTIGTECQTMFWLVGQGMVWCGDG